MADLLTHVLVPYVLLTVAGWRIDWIADRWVVVGMAGAAIPDLGKFEILVSEGLVERLLGVPFSFAPIGTLGGVLLIAGAVALWFERNRKRAYAFLVFGGVSALVLDGLRMYADGRAEFWLYPFVWWRPPTPNLYVTSDPRVLAVAVTASTVVFLLDRRVGDS